MKDIDLRREKYFNIKLLESYSSFISKFETVYNNTVVNYNILNGIGKIHATENELDYKYLYDYEYKFNDSLGNSSSKAYSKINGQIYSINMIDSGSGIDARSFKVNNVTQGATYRAIVLGSTESSITAPTIVVEGKKINMLNHTPNASYQVIYNNSNVGNSVNLLSIVDKNLLMLIM